MGDFLFNPGMVLLRGGVLFHVVTLPVELDASRRALAQLQAVGAVTSQQEIAAARKMLSAAAMTYFAALAMSMANLLRMFAMRRRN